ncbi:hypothetical protein JVT61DRAFT_10683 [Boletus reticuloceps]|uniref:Uncharacterized protein n=1 Tax=Boletus reticuloceps TaxID=495285 RepID=A0A8I3A5Y5_9AGAM|nr:hypothetical protein JVT61DRAFT_10683 [Boletus reticuloceps]
MEHISMTFPFRPVVDVGTFDYSYDIHPGNNRYLVSFQHRDPASVPLISTAELEFTSLYDPLGMAAPSLPSYPNPSLDEPTAHNSVPAPSFENEELPYNIPSANHPYLHQADATTPECLPSPSSSAPSYSSASSVTFHSQSPSELPNVALGATGAFDQTQTQAAIHLPSTSTAFHWFGSNGGTLPTPVPLPTPDPSNTLYACQCVTGGQTCNAQVRGNTRAVRDHLKLGHAFRSVGKDRVACLWAGCGQAMQRENIPRHILTCHFRVTVNCNDCGLQLSRRDVQPGHARVCPARRRTASRLDAGASSANAR